MRRATTRAALLAAAVAVAAAVSGAGAATKAARPTFASYQAPSGMGDDAGEPTLGVDPKTQAVLFPCHARVLRVTGFNGRGGATWKDVTPLVTGLYSFDPILETDTKTGRTFTSQLDLW